MDPMTTLLVVQSYIPEYRAPFFEELDTRLRALGVNLVLGLGRDTTERGDAARNRALLLDAARRLIAQRGPDAVSMDDIAAAAGVGKGTVFRRFGSRAGLMTVLLDSDEQASQQSFMFGPPPLGPGAPPVERLVAFGAARIEFSHTHAAILSQANTDPQTRFASPATNVLRRHVHTLLTSAGTTGDLTAQTDTLIALLDPDYITYRISAGSTLDALSQEWESLARKLCGR